MPPDRNCVKATKEVGIQTDCTIELSTDNKSICPFESTSVSSTVKDPCDIASDCDNITFVSSNPAVAKVDPDSGTVTPKKTGSTTITAEKPESCDCKNDDHVKITVTCEPERCQPDEPNTKASAIADTKEENPHLFCVEERSGRKEGTISFDTRLIGPEGEDYTQTINVNLTPKNNRFPWLQNPQDKSFITEVRIFDVSGEFQDPITVNRAKQTQVVNKNFNAGNSTMTVKMTGPRKLKITKDWDESNLGGTEDIDRIEVTVKSAKRKFDLKMKNKVKGTARNQNVCGTKTGEVFAKNNVTAEGIFVSLILSSNRLSTYLPTSTPTGGEGNNIPFTAEIRPEDVEKKITFELFSITMFPGFATNKGKKENRDRDFKILKIRNPNLDVMDVKGVEFRAETLQKVNQSNVVVSSFDYGGRALIKARIEIDGKRCESILAGTENKNRTTVPLDQDEERGDFLADVWEDRIDGQFISSSKIATRNGIHDRKQDEDRAITNQVPAQHQDRGDGLTAFQEYRGFIIDGSHARLDQADDEVQGAFAGGPVRKDMFVRDPDGVFDHNSLMDKFGLVYHIVDKEEIKDDLEINPNRIFGNEQKTLKYVQEDLAEGVWGRSTVNVDQIPIKVDVSDIQNNGGNVNSVVAHEAGNAFDLFHTVGVIGNHSPNSNVIDVTNILNLSVNITNNRKTVELRNFNVATFGDLWLFKRDEDRSIDFIESLFGEDVAPISSVATDAVIDQNKLGRRDLLRLDDIFEAKGIIISDSPPFIDTIKFDDPLPPNVSESTNGIRGYWQTNHIMDFQCCGSNLRASNSGLTIIRTANSGRR